MTAVTIDLKTGAEPIAGSLRIEGGPPSPFRGWLQLTSLLQTAAANATALPGSNDPVNAHAS